MDGDIYLKSNEAFFGRIRRKKAFLYPDTDELKVGV